MKDQVEEANEVIQMDCHDSLDIDTSFRLYFPESLELFNTTTSDTIGIVTRVKCRKPCAGRSRIGAGQASIRFFRVVHLILKPGFVGGGVMVGII
jgi:hypothetical protein